MFDTYAALLERLTEIVTDGSRDKIFRGHAVRFLVQDHGLDWPAVLSPIEQRDERRDAYTLQLIAYGHAPPNPRDFGHALARVLVEAPMFDLALASVLVNRADLTQGETRALGDFIRRQIEEYPR